MDDDETLVLARGERTRIEGSLHRSLPCDIRIRKAADGAADDGLLRLRLSVSSDAPYLRESWWDDPWVETLGHKAGEVDLSRFNGGAAVMANHDRWRASGTTPLAGIGAIERAWLDGGRLYCDIVISRREALADLRQDIADGLVRNVSIGYRIDERVLTKAAAGGKPAEYRVTRWQPHEVSLVDIPADAGVGLGRAEGAATTSPRSQPGYRVVALSHLKRTTMDERDDTTTASPATTAATAASQAATVASARAAAAEAAMTAERERVREISALGKQTRLAELAERAIDAGTTLDEFRKQVIEHGVKSGHLRVAESAEIGLNPREIEQFSFCRAMLAAADPLAAAQLAPFELECSRAAQAKRSDSRPKDREAAFTIPVDVLASGIQVPARAAASVARMLIARAQRGAESYGLLMRDLMTTPANAGGNVVATELWASSFIELLRNALVLDRMGATFLRDLNGNVAIPSQTGGATAYWLAEGGSPTESQQAFGQVALTPKTVGAYTDYSRRLLLQSSIDIEAFVRADLAAVLAQEVLRATINGSGAGSEPMGILNTSGVGIVPTGANGGAPGYDHLVALETALGAANADAGSMAFLTNSKVRGKYRLTQVFAGTNGQPCWTNGSQRGVGELLGYDAHVTNAVPSNLAKGTGTNLSANIFGNWADLLIGMWGGLDLMLDPYAMSTSGGKRLVALQDLDIQLRRVVSFAVQKDINTN